MGPGAELVAIGQSVTVVVVFGVARVKGVGEGPLARVRERPLVEVASDLWLRSRADSCSKPSSTPSPSVSLLQGSVLIAASTEFGSKSPSKSEPLPQVAGAPPRSAETISGELRRSLTLPYVRLTRTRRRNRVGLPTPLESRLVSRRSTEAGTRTTSLPRLARRGLANAVRLPGERKMTVLRRRLEENRAPRIVIVRPTVTRIGETSLIVDALATAVVAACAGTPGRTAKRAPRRARAVTVRRIPPVVSTGREVA